MPLLPPPSRGSPSLASSRIPQLIPPVPARFRAVLSLFRRWFSAVPRCSALFLARSLCAFYCASSGTPLPHTSEAAANSAVHICTLCSRFCPPPVASLFPLSPEHLCPASLSFSFSILFLSTFFRVGEGAPLGSPSPLVGLVWRPSSSLFHPLA